jgi:coenzyme F420-0:L-glutamate ligase/coenzyme F420-1:gamma-L-glutamate ligase
LLYLISTKLKLVRPLEIFPLQSPRIINFGESVYDSFVEAIKSSQLILQENDVISVTSKVYSMQEKAATKLVDVEPSKEAVEIAKLASMDPRVVQLVLDESDGPAYGQVFHAILVKTPYGLSANAGIDLSNCPEGYALLLPKEPDKLAREFRNKIKDDFGINVAVIITDSRTIPLRRGAMAVAIGIAGMEPVIDERGNIDLYGYVMTISTRAIADNIASSTSLVMGETNERIPFAVVRGVNYNIAEKSTMLSTNMPEDQCLYFGPLLRLIKENKKNE